MCLTCAGVCVCVCVCEPCLTQPSRQALGCRILEKGGGEGVGATRLDVPHVCRCVCVCVCVCEPCLTQPSRQALGCRILEKGGGEGVGATRLDVPHVCRCVCVCVCVCVSYVHVRITSLTYAVFPLIVPSTFNTNNVFNLRCSYDW